MNGQQNSDDLRIEKHRSTKLHHESLLENGRSYVRKTGQTPYPIDLSFLV